MKNRFPIYFNLILIVIMDALLLGASWYCSFLLRFNFDIPVDNSGMILRLMPVIVLIKVIVFYFFHVYRGMWRYTSIIDLYNIIKASVFSSLVIMLLIMLSHSFTGFARSVFVIDGMFTLLFISGSRICLRLYFEMMSEERFGSKLTDRLLGRQKIGKEAINLLIIGAGDSGEKIFREIRDNKRLKYHVVGFLDDDYAKQRRMIHGIPVLGRVEDLKSVAETMDAHEILIAVPSATSEQMRSIVDQCKQSELVFKTLPGIGELIDGKVTLNAIRDVAYRDLLGREVVQLEEGLIGEYLDQKQILVTGAGGSIGSELCRQICRFNPKTIILFDQAESPLYDIDLELRRSFPYIQIVPVLGDIRNRSRLINTFEKHRPQNVFHAAAYKHVPMLEIQPWEAILNNIGGTRNVVNISKQFGVERFVMVSTDKAVRPTNIMGTTKRIAELLVQGQSCDDPAGTRFITVRFGNVVGSVGSVVPLFKRQIEQGGPVTITHPEVTRYFMTIPEASQLILQAGAMGKGGETFILEMGTSVKIVDMARDLIRLSGFEPDKDIKIEYIGLRPGEKLYEELITKGEDIVPTAHKKIMVLSGQACDQLLLNDDIDRIIEVAKAQDGEKIKTMLKQIVPEYVPSNH
ncbi:MAG: nucleoside-diphosphate sugar epimerase/dehydratase [Pseudomonadota bacterium]